MGGGCVSVCTRLPTSVCVCVSLSVCFCVCRTSSRFLSPYLCIFASLSFFVVISRPSPLSLFRCLSRVPPSSYSLSTSPSISRSLGNSPSRDETICPGETRLVPSHLKRTRPGLVPKFRRVHPPSCLGTLYKKEPKQPTKPPQKHPRSKQPRRDRRTTSPGALNILRGQEDRPRYRGSHGYHGLRTQREYRSPNLKCTSGTVTLRPTCPCKRSVDHFRYRKGPFTSGT